MGMYRSFTAVLAVLGTSTDDGRLLDAGMNVSFRDFPLPLSWQRMSDDGHRSAYTVGVLEDMSVQNGQVVATGYMLDSPEATEAMSQVEHGVTEPSVTLGDVSWELRDETGRPITMDDLWDLPMDAKLTEVTTAGKVLGATLVAIPAHGHTSITLGDMVERGADAPALMASAALDYVPVTYPAAFFADPGFAEPTSLHMTDDGRIQGHLATWNMCHTGIADRCVMAPHSRTDYAWFHTSPPVLTDTGERVKVGRLTVGGGHAAGNLSAGPAVAHYDDVGTCFALVHVGEDEYGIWVSGVPAPGATADQLDKGLAAALSGDWREVGGNLELIAALSVNTPGFPIIASGATDGTGAPLSLVASLGPCRPTTKAFTTSDIPELARAVVSEMHGRARRSARAGAIIGEYRTKRARELFARIDRGGQ